MFDVGGQRGERRKWIQVFDGITAVLFVVACSGFNSRLREDRATYRMNEALKLFEEVWQSRFLRDSGFILFLNKQDLLRDKIANGARMEDYYPEYADYQYNAAEDSSSEDKNLNFEYRRARSFIRDKFLHITQCTDTPCLEYHRSESSSAVSSHPGHSVSCSSSVSSGSHQNHQTSRSKSTKKRECFWHYTTATDTNCIERVFDDIHTMIIRCNLRKISIA